MAQVIISSDSKLKYELNDLTKHAAVLGTTGSGKTVMCKVLIEEALLKGIPVIAIDPKGDISGLGIHDKNYDFRPFLSNAKAQRTAQSYIKNNQKTAPVFNHTTKIFTPKSNAGIKVSLMPSLECPKNFNKINKDISTTSALIEPISDSLVNLSGITSNKDKVQTLISQIILDSWNNNKNLTINDLIQKIISPDFSQIGSLELEDFLKEKDRMKAASSINLLLSSPSKKVWSEGTSLNVKEMLKKNSLNVFDLRFCHSQTEKQFVVEQILQQLYKFLLEQGGSSNLKYILYIDELAGLLPPPPSNPVSKKLLETLIRQARAFGLGIVVATQNPGDIDYKILGNIGSRFIGKLRTDNDVEKVASATDNKPSELKTVLSGLKTGEFFLNNAVRNKNTKFKTRWVFTLHEGPLKEQEISWINNPASKPASLGKLKVEFKEKTKHLKKESFSMGDVVVRRGVLAKKSSEIVQKKQLQKKNKNLQSLISSVKKNVDSLNINVALSQNKALVYTPHLKIVIEPKPYKDNELKIQGPFLFDLTTKAIPVGNYLSKRTWSQYVSEEVEIEKPKTSIKQVVDYSLKEAKQNIKTDFFESKITNVATIDIDLLVEKNTAYLKKLSAPKIQRLKLLLDKKLKDLESKKSENNKKIKQLRFKTNKRTASRAIKKIFSNKKLLDKTIEMKHWEKRINQLKKDNNKLEARISLLKNNYDKNVKKLNDIIFEKARTQIKKIVYLPKNKDLIVKGTLLLIPKRVSKK